MTPAHLMVATALFLSAPATAASVQSAQESDRAAILPFQNGVVQYAALHHRIETSIPPTALPADKENLYVLPAALRDQLLRARGATPEGRIFTPRAGAVFRRLITEHVHGDYAALLKATHEDRDELGRAVVNERWPGTALTMMPPDLLRVLPPLPPELEYRFVHRDLVLWDVRADLIVDVLRDAIPLEIRGTPK
jgi:hypothetical protein